MNIKRAGRAVFVSIAFVALCILSFLCGCEGARTLNIKDWNDTQEEVTLGKAYSLDMRRPVTEDGETCALSAEVIRLRDGKKVNLINDAFDILDVGGYRITYTATSGKASAVRNVTLSVADKDAPVIVVSGVCVAEKGVRYNWDNIAVTDATGEIDDITVVGKSPSGDDVVCDKKGFTPDAVGKYDFTMTAKDGSSNTAVKEFSVFARNERTANELDAFDDEGLAHTAYTKADLSIGSAYSATYSSFRRLKSSGGSASFNTGANISTEFVFSPRCTASVMNSQNYISAWIYIAAYGKVAEFPVTFGNKTENVKANKWYELKITSAEIGDYTQFFYQLGVGGRSLFSVRTDGTDCTVFVDDVYAADKTAIELQGLKESYAAGEAIRFSAPDGMTVEYSYAGKQYELTSGTVPVGQGEYVINAYTPDRKKGVSYSLTVGTLSGRFDRLDWVTYGKEIELPVFHADDGGAETVISQTEYRYVDLYAGESHAAEEKFLPDSYLFGIEAIARTDSGTVAAFEIYTANEFDKNTWFGINSSMARKTDYWSIEWHDEVDGEKGVLEFKNPDYANNKAMMNFDFLKPLYGKSHYENAQRIVFRMKLGPDTTGADVCYICNNGWKAVRIGKVTSEWTDVSVDISLIMKNFDAFADGSVIEVTTNENGGSVYLSQAYVVFGSTDEVGSKWNGAWI